MIKFVMWIDNVDSSDEESLREIKLSRKTARASCTNPSNKYREITLRKQ